jgi:hypothetical protein
MPPWSMQADTSSTFIKATGPKRVWEAVEVLEVLFTWRQCGGVAAIGPHAERSEIKIGVTSHTIRLYLHG